MESIRLTVGVLASAVLLVLLLVTVLGIGTRRSGTPYKSSVRDAHLFAVKLLFCTLGLLVLAVLVMESISAGGVFGRVMTPLLYVHFGCVAVALVFLVITARYFNGNRSRQHRWFAYASVVSLLSVLVTGAILLNHHH